MKRAALYLRVSTFDQHSETQLHDLRGLAKHHHGFVSSEAGLLAANGDPCIQAPARIISVILFCLPEISSPRLRTVR